MQSCVDLNRQVALVQVDLANAFERVNHELLFMLLEHANIGQIVTGGVQLCYRNCATCLIVNGTLTASIAIESSVKQGCPMSLLLFALYLESLCVLAKNCPLVGGYRLLADEVKVLAYADDMTYFCKDKRGAKR